ncbi:ABC transporter permease [Arenimonas fontis]|uniref:FtsX-like permease family protein n=1 Tax=Arenimonas fontis TaxID=2608255 RepID=A0A5B2Z971_9GAMM|nr:FtsX-like permease family protein [Arenimonas fontis]KAA2284455.1 FtsX-like permease family protein [Arenimonas fontis]
MKPLRLAWRQFRRDLGSGDIRILLAALVLAVTAVCSVGFVTDRAERALALEANRLLGGDAVLRADAPIVGALREAASAPGLRAAETVGFPSMVRAGEALRLGELRALGEGFPLRGQFVLRDAAGREAPAPGVPAPGTVWLSRAGADTLGARIGDRIGVGLREFELAALVVQEPDAALDYFNTAPRLFLALADLESTGLVQPGSRITYRLAVAGTPAAVERFTTSVGDKLDRGQRLETAAEARPEIRRALDRADRFLGLAALVSVVLAAVAVAMAARRHGARHLQGAAVMRSLGASQRDLVLVHGGELLLAGLLGCLFGLSIAFGLQWAVGVWLAEALKLDLPGAGWRPVLEGFAVGLTVLLAFGLPPVLALRRVPALRVLRSDLDPTEPSAWLVLAAGLAGLSALLWWKAGSAVLGTAMLAGIAITLTVLALLAWGLILLVRSLRRRLRGAWRYGLANVGRRAGASIAQVSALGLGLMALLLLGFVRTDLLERWRQALPEDAPNRFIVNVQPDQVQPLRSFVARRGLAEPTLFPMIRARLIELNGRPASGSDYPEGSRARRMAEREFNLSAAEALRSDNEVVAGRFWQGRPAGPELSVEEDFARDLGWRLGDEVAFDIAGARFAARITSLRKVDWESFQPNFFVLASPGALDGFSGSHITAVKVPAGDTRFTAELVAAFPNLSVVDVDVVLDQIRGTVDQVSTVVEAVFAFALLAGLLVLMAAVSASQDERLLEGGVMRVLGGRRRQLRLAQASEFAALGLIAGLVAAIAASLLAGVVARRVFDLPWTPDPAMIATGAGAGLVAALLAGLYATRRVVDAPPSVTLRELQG